MAKGVKGVGSLLASLPTLFMRVIPVIGTLALAFQFLPDSIKKALTEAIGLRTLDADAKRVVERTKSLNKEFENFADVQKELATDIEGNFAITLNTLQAVADFDLSTSIQQQKKLFEELREAQDAAADTADRMSNMGYLAPIFKFLDMASGGAVSQAYGDWASGYNEVAEAASKSLETTMKALDVITMAGNASTATRAYAAEVRILSDMLDKNSGIYTRNQTAIDKQVIKLNAAKAAFQEFSKEIKNLTTNLKQLPQIVDTAFSSLLPKGRFENVIAGLTGVTGQIFKLDEMGNVLPELTKFGKEFKLSLGEEELAKQAELIAGYARIQDIFVGLRDTENTLLVISQQRQTQEMALTTNMTKRQQQLQKENTTILNLGEKIAKSAVAREAKLKAIAATQESITKDQINELALQEAKENLMKAQLEVLQKQQEAGHKIRMSLREGFDQGLESNIYDLITGAESSVKDAVLKVGQTALKSLAKELSRQLTDQIMGVFGFQTKEDKERQKNLQVFIQGAEKLREAIQKAFDDARTKAEAIAKDPRYKALTEEGGRQAAGAGAPLTDPARGSNPSNPVFVSVVPSPGLGATAEGSTIPGYSLAGGLPKVGPGPLTTVDGGPAISGGETLGEMEERLLKQKIGIGEGGKSLIDPVSGGIKVKVVGGDGKGFTRIGEGGTPSGTGAEPEESRGLFGGAARRRRRAEARENKTADQNTQAANTLKAGADGIKQSSGIFSEAAANNVLSAGVQNMAAGDMKGAGVSMLMAAAQMMVSSFTSAIGFAASGGVFSEGKKRSYQPGGIASGPSSGYPVMLHGTEAVVPLPDGKSIPVQMSGGGGGINNVTVNVNMETGETTTEENKGPNMAELGKTVAAAVQAELQHQKRPGGILSPFGAS